MKLALAVYKCSGRRLNNSEGKSQGMENSIVANLELVFKMSKFTSKIDIDYEVNFQKILDDIDVFLA